MHIQGCTDENLFPVVRRIMGGFVTNRMPVLMNGVYRGRKNPPGTLFHSPSELWYPPANVVKAGRLNRQGESMFYATDKMNVVAKELKLDVGDIFTVMMARAREDVANAKLAHLGLHKCKDPQLAPTINEFLPRNQRDMREEMRNGGFQSKWKKVDDFLAEVLTDTRVMPNPEDQYRLSNAIGDLMKRIDGIDGIVYPSVAVRLEAVNICFFPAFVDRTFEPEKFRMFKVIDKLPNGDLITSQPQEGSYDKQAQRISWP